MSIGQIKLNWSIYAVTGLENLEILFRVSKLNAIETKYLTS